MDASVHGGVVGRAAGNDYFCGALRSIVRSVGQRLHGNPVRAAFCRIAVAIGCSNCDVLDVVSKRDCRLRWLNTGRRKMKPHDISLPHPNPQRQRIRRCHGLLRQRPRLSESLGLG